MTRIKGQVVYNLCENQTSVLPLYLFLLFSVVRANVRFLASTIFANLLQQINIATMIYHKILSGYKAVAHTLGFSNDLNVANCRGMCMLVVGSWVSTTGKCRKIHKISSYVKP